MIYKGQKLSDNLTKSQRDMFRHLIDQGHTIEQIVEMYIRFGVQLVAYPQKKEIT